MEALVQFDCVDTSNKSAKIEGTAPIEKDGKVKFPQSLLKKMKLKSGEKIAFVSLGSDDSCSSVLILNAVDLQASVKESLGDLI